MSWKHTTPGSKSYVESYTLVSVGQFGSWPKVKSVTWFVIVKVCTVRGQPKVRLNVAEPVYVGKAARLKMSSTL